MRLAVSGHAEARCQPRHGGEAFQDVAAALSLWPVRSHGRCRRCQGTRGTR